MKMTRGKNKKEVQETGQKANSELKQVVVDTDQNTAETTNLDEAKTNGNDQAATKAEVKAPSLSSEDAPTPAKPAKNNQPKQNKETEKGYFNIKLVDDTTGKTIETFNDTPGSGRQLAYDSEGRGQIMIDKTGYKLLNPEALTSQIDFDDPDQVGQMGSGWAYIKPKAGQTLDLTLHYGELAPIYVKFEDTEGNLLTQYGVDGDSSANMSPMFVKQGLQTSRIEARAIEIPGYELVSEPVVIQAFDQVKNSATDPNPITVKFTYQKVAAHAEAGLPKDFQNTITGTNQGSSWAALDSGTSIDMTKHDYAEAGFEEMVQGMRDKYEQRGYSYLGLVNYHKGSEKLNDLEKYYHVNFLKNLPVTVKYLDTDGNELADSVVLSSNPYNNDRTNEGVDPAHNWNPEGDWHSKAKQIPGYVLMRVNGSESGKFTNFAYTTAYIYTKAAQAQIKYIDDDNNDVMKSDEVNGGVGMTIDYSTANNIRDFEKAGYQLVKDGFKVGDKYNADPAKNIFEVHFKKVSNPVNPSQPTDPSQPTSPTSPVNPTNPSQPTPPANPTQPTSTVQPSEPTTPQPTPDDNVVPHPEQPVDNPDDSSDSTEETVMPHSQDGDTDITRTVKPHSGKVEQTVNKTAVKTPKQAVSVQQTLPQTGEGDDFAEVIGLASMSLAMIGLLGVKKRKQQ